MNSILSSYLKSIAVLTVILSAAIGTSLAINPAFVMVPQQNYTHHLYDESGDVSDPNIDILEFGSNYVENEVIIYLTVNGIFHENATYQVFIVAKTSENEAAHIYFIDIDVKTESELNYGSLVNIANDTLTIHFSVNDLIPDSYMIGLEARASNFDERDTTPSARNNTLLTKFLGIF